MTTTRNPFSKPEKVEPKVKALLFGGPGIGKTYGALSAPGTIAMIDTESGTAFYAGRKGLSPFERLTTKSYAEVRDAIEYLATPEGAAAFATVVIDPVTIIYETLQTSALIRRVEMNKRRRRGATDVDEADLEQLDWGRIKRNYKQLMTNLVNLPQHVIVTAREKAETRRNPQTGEFETTGNFLPDSEKGTSYYFDVVLHMRRVGDDGREAVVIKDRTGGNALGARVALPDGTPAFSTMFAAVLKSKGTAHRDVPDDAAAAAHDADEEERGNGPSARSIAVLMEWLEAAGKDPDEILATLKKSSFAELSPDAIAKLTKKAKDAAGESAAAEPAPAPDPAPAESSDVADAAAEVA